MNRLVLLLITCALLIVAVLTLTETSRRTLGLVDLLPRDSLALVECRHLPQAWERWRDGLVGSTVLRHDFPQFLARHHLAETGLLPGAPWLAALEGVSRQPGFAQLFAGHVIIALTPAPPGEDSDPVHLINRLLFLREVVPGTDVNRQLSLVFGEANTTTTSSYQGKTLHHLRLDQGQELTYLLQDNLLLWAFDARIVRQCVQQLVQTLVPTQARRQVPPTFLRLRDMAKTGAEVYVYAQEQALRTLFPQVGRFLDEKALPVPGHLAIFASPMPQGERLVLTVLADEQQLRALRQRYHLQLPVMKPALERLSATTCFVVWTNWFHLDRLWASVLAKGPSDLATLFAQGAESLTGMLGMSIDTMLALFGNEAGFFLDYLHAPHQAPRSKACLTIEIHDLHRVETVCKRLLTGLQTVEVVSGGLRIVTTILANGLLQPAYALFDQQLVLADGVELIERWYGLNRPQSGELPQGRFLDDQRCNFFLFLRTGDMVEWLLPMSTAIGKEYAARLGEEYRNWILADPFFNAFLGRLRNIETSRIRGLIDTDTMLLELVWTMHSR